MVFFFSYIPAKEQDTTHKKPSELLYLCRLLGLCHPSNVDTDAWPLSPFIQFFLLLQPNFSNSTTPNPAKMSCETKKCTAGCMATLSQNHAPQQPPLINWAESPYQLTPIYPSGLWKRQGEKIMQWRHTSHFYTGNREWPFQILISWANAIAFVAMLVSPRSYIRGRYVTHIQKIQFSYKLR